MSDATPERWNALTKKQAFAIHMALSILIFGSLVAVMMVWWFPGKLFFLDGGWQGLKIVALIDLVLGPALTLLLYAPGKPKLLLDMSFIAVFQLSALAYGFYATYHQRTAAVVYADRNFITLSADAAKVAKQELTAREKPFRAVSEIDNSIPAMLLTPEPKPSEFGQYMSELLSGFPELHERLDLMVKRGPEHAEMLSARAVTMDRLEVTGADKLVQKALDELDHDKDDIELHYFKARYAKGIVLYSKAEQDIIDYVTVPWDALIAQKEKENTQDSDIESGRVADGTKKNTSAPVSESVSDMAESVEQ